MPEAVHPDLLALRQELAAVPRSILAGPAGQGFLQWAQEALDGLRVVLAAGPPPGSPKRSFVQKLALWSVFRTWNLGPSPWPVGGTPGFGPDEAEEARVRLLADWQECLEFFPAASLSRAGFRHRTLGDLDSFEWLRLQRIGARALSLGGGGKPAGGLE